MEKKTVVFKEKMDRNKIIACMNDLLDSFKAGTVCIQHGEDLVTLKLNAHISLEMEASVKKGKERLTIELSWRNDKEHEDKEFRIMAEEPVSETEDETVSA